MLPAAPACYLIAAQSPRSGVYTTLLVGRTHDLRARMRDHACRDSDFRMQLKVARPGQTPAPTHVLVADSAPAAIVEAYDKRLAPVRAALDPDATGYERVLRFLFPSLCEPPPAHRRLVEEMRRLYGAAAQFRIAPDGEMTACAPVAIVRAA
jgi:hypothetical protein